MARQKGRCRPHIGLGDVKEGIAGVNQSQSARVHGEICQSFGGVYRRFKRRLGAGRICKLFCKPHYRSRSCDKTRISDNLSVYTAELIAIKQALSWIKENDSGTCSGHPIVVFSDSLSALQSIKRGRSNTRPNLVRSIVQDINSITGQRITLAWIPSHVDIRGNEIADKEAKSALTLMPHVIEFEEKETYEAIDKYLVNKWQKIYTADTTGQSYKLLCPTVSHSIKYQSACRLKEIAITRLRAGRCRLNKYLHEFKLHDTGLCDQCNVPETIEHHLLYCDTYDMKDVAKNMCLERKLDLSVKSVLSSTEIIDKIYPLLTRSL